MKSAFTLFHDFLQHQHRSLHDSFTSSLSLLRQDFKELLAGKADVQDVSRAVSEAIQHTAFDHRPDLDDLRRQLSLRASKHDLATSLKAQTAVLEELRKDQT